MKTVIAFLRAFWNDEHGFIVSAELVLVGTIGVLSMVVGLSAVSRSVTNELYDMADAFNSVNQYDDDDHYDDYRGNQGYAGNTQQAQPDIVGRN